MEINSDKLIIKATLLHENAKAYLKSTSTSHGWSDFSTHKSGRSTHWITAYVLALTGDEFPEQTKHFVDMFCTKNGEIGYNEKVPSDSDSTALGLLACMQARLIPPLNIINNSVNLLRQHEVFTDSVGLSTYSSNSKIHHYKTNFHDFNGWCGTSVHEITAVAMTAFANPLLCNDQKDFALKWFKNIDQSIDNLHSYWWTSDWYLYKWLSEAWCRWKETTPYLDENNTSVTDKIKKKWLACEPVNIETPFECACYLSTGFNLYSSTVKPDIFWKKIEDCLSVLDVTKIENGYWKSDSIMRIPLPSDKTPWNSNYFSKSHGGTSGLHGDYGVFTSATVFEATNFLCKKISD